MVVCLKEYLTCAALSFRHSLDVCSDKTSPYKAWLLYLKINMSPFGVSLNLTLFNLTFLKKNISQKYEISTNQRPLNLPLTNQRQDVFYCVPMPVPVPGEIGLTSSVRIGVGPEIMINSSNVS